MNATKILLTLLISTIAEFVFLDVSSMAAEISEQDQSIILAEISSLTGGINLMQIFLSFMFLFSRQKEHVDCNGT